MQTDDLLLVGVDMVKPKEILERAYNDRQEVTARFNRNILNVINGITGTNFRLDSFEHNAFYNEKYSRIEMHLKALRNVVITSSNYPFQIEIKRGESIQTENSYKFTVNKINELVEAAGLKIDTFLMDQKKWFSLLQLTKKQSAKPMLDITTIRSDFPILERLVYGKKLVYLDNAATTHKPVTVLEKLRKFYSESNSNIHRGSHYLSEMASEYYETARDSVKKFINAKSSREIIFTHGTTESINVVARCFGEQRVKEGDEVIITEMEHHSNLVPWQVLCTQKRATLKVVPFDNEGALQLNTLKSFICEKTAMIALTYISNVTGAVNPVKEIISIAHAYDIAVLIDAAQAVQHKAIDVMDLDCDFLVFSGHKMYAETGVGVLYGKEKWLDLMSPFQYGGGMVASVDFDKTTFAELPFKFEAGTPNIAGVISLNASIDYISKIGIKEIYAHEQNLLRYAVRQLSHLEGVKLFGLAAQQCGVVSFNIENIGAYDAAMILDKLGIALRSGTHCAEPVMKHFGVKGTIRASFALYNTIEEVCALIQGIKKVQSMFRY